MQIPTSRAHWHSHAMFDACASKEQACAAATGAPEQLPSRPTPLVAPEQIAKTPTCRHLGLGIMSAASAGHLPGCSPEARKAPRSSPPRPLTLRATHQTPGAAPGCQQCARQCGISASSLHRLCMPLHAQTSNITKRTGATLKHAGAKITRAAHESN